MGTDAISAPVNGLVGRPVISNATRVVVKAGSSSLTRSDGHLDRERIDRLVDCLAERARQGHQLVVVSSGAIASGIGPLGLSGFPRDLATAQAAASVGQGALMSAWSAGFARHGLVAAQVLMTADDFGRRVHYRNAQRALRRLLELSVVPVINENDAVATDEIRMGDNDRLAALVAHLVRAEALVLLSDVDALYDAPPGTSGAKVIPEVWSLDQLADVRVRGPGSPVGSGGMRTKIEAARIASGAGIPVLLASADQAADALAGRQVGTMFHPAGKLRTSRQLWLAHASSPEGVLVLDQGAVRAVCGRGASLLPAGIVSIKGSFQAGDPVDLSAEDGTVVARGLVNFDSSELPDLMGCSTRDLAVRLGPAYEREVVHRDDLAVLVRETPGKGNEDRE